MADKEVAVMARKGLRRSRLSRSVVIGAVATAAAAGIAVGTLPASAATAPSWSPAGPPGVSGTVTAVTSVQYGGTKTGEWAFVTTAYETNFKGYPSVYSRTNGESWAKATLPGSEPGEVFVSATAINNKSVLAFTTVPNGTGREWQFNGSTWRVIKTFGAPIGGASVTSASNVWVFGSASSPGHLGVYHYNGQTWTKLASTLNGGQGLSAGNAWAYTGSTVAHYNGKAWTGTNLASLIPGSAPRVIDVYDTDGTTYAVAAGVASKTEQTIAILDYNGHSWARIDTVTAASGVPNQISSDGDGGIWFPVIDVADSGSAAVVHYTRSVKKLSVTDLPGSIGSITRVDRTNELAGGSVPSGKVNPATYAELEYYD
jgi:hypothetical protein